jgi:tetratricopeptide (TPR) repeat protein
MGEGADAKSESRRYVAFLSYAHADRAVGRWLHRALERYRTPRRLVKERGAPRRLVPIFRDREELPAGGHLPDRLEAALAASDHLVVLCSPKAAASEWVGKEVATFKRLGKGEAIIPVIAPSLPQDAQPADAFPPALRFAVDGAGAVTDRPDPAERLGADLRTAGDGRREGLLKVVAGLLGVGFAEVKQREVEAARRRAAFAYGLVGLFAAISVVAVGALWLALDRNERLQAALVGILDVIVADVDDVFARSATGEVTTEEALRTLARAERQVNIAFGLASDNDRLLREEARMRVAFARLHSQAGQREQARAASERANAILAQLGEGDSDGVAWMAAEAAGDLALSEGRVDDALVAYERALSLARETDSQRNVSVYLERIADVRRAQGAAGDALAAYEEGLAIRRDLAARNPDNLGYQRDVYVSEFKLGTVQEALGEPAAAAELYRSALERNARLIAVDPSRAEYADDRRVLEGRLAAVTGAAP